MPSPNYDLGYLRAGINTLESYLLSQDLYWSLDASPPSGELPYPRLTLGTLLLAQARLRAAPLSFSQEGDLIRLDAQIDAARTRWRVAWGRKAGREFHAFLNLWRDFLEEYRRTPGENVNRYAYEVRRRAILDILSDEDEGIPAEERKLLTALDRLLRAMLLPATFVWEAELAAGFPPQKYWYLYGRLKED
jgi:hypothetical protein